jgi:hypothetical protein
MKHEQQKERPYLAARSSDAAPESAQYEHDCDTCVFLGRFSCDGIYAGSYDLYYHAETPSGVLYDNETVIARFGEFGDYYSGMHFAQPYVSIDGTQQPGIAPLVEAKRRAIERGLIVNAEKLS